MGESKANESVFRNKRFKIGSIVVLALCLILGGLAIAGWYIEQRIPERIKEAVAQNSQGQYRLEFEKLTLSLISGHLRLQQAELLPDSQRYHQLDSASRAGYLVSVECAGLEIAGLRWLGYVLNKNKAISVSSIVFDRPAVKLYRMRSKQDTAEKDTSLAERLPERIQGMSIGKILVNQLHFEHYSLDNHQQAGLELQNLNLVLSDILLDSAAFSDRSRVFFAKDIQAGGKEVIYNLPKALYQMKLKGFELSSREKMLRVDSFALIPRYGEREFVNQFRYATSRYELGTVIGLKDIDFKALETGGLQAEQLSLKNGSLRVYTDKSKPSSNEKVIENSPHLALQRLDFPIYIQELAVDSLDITYREFTPSSQATGEVSFAHMKGELKNITNDSVMLAKEHWARGHFEMAFQQQTPLKVDLNFNLSSPEGEFTYKGTLAGAPANRYSKKLLEPLAMVKVEKGMLNSISFDVKANKRGSYGTVDMRYKDVKISLLAREQDGGLGKEGLLSFLTNAFIITSDNPKEGLPPRVSHFQYTHSPYHSFFNLMWKSVFEGIKDIVVESKEQKKQDRKKLREIKREEKRAARQGR